MHASKTAMDVCSKSAWTLTTAPHLVAKPALITSVCFFFSGEEEEGEEGIWVVWDDKSSEAGPEDVSSDLSSPEVS